MISVAVYSEKIADNDRKIEQLSKNIKRDTEKRKKLMEENARLSYQAICEQYNCTGQDLLDILSREHQQAEMLQTSGLSDADIAELTRHFPRNRRDDFYGYRQQEVRKWNELSERIE